MNLNVTFSDPTGRYTSQADLLIRNFVAAFDMWRIYLADSAASIEVNFHLVTNYANRGGGSSPGLNELGAANGIRIFEAGAGFELRTGNDANAAGFDIDVFFDVDFMTQYYWINPLDGTPAPNNKSDLVDVIGHEIGHALGFNGYRDWGTYQLPGFNATNFDLLVTIVDGKPFFNGPNAVAHYGGPVPLTAGNIFHVGNANQTLVSDIMNGVVFNFGSPYVVSVLDALILSDLGVPTIFNDVLTGSTKADVMNGGAGSDTLSGLAGADSLNGGSGVDTGVFAGNRAAYTITKVGTGGTITGPDGTDTIINIEWLKFSDQTIRFRPGAGTTVDINNVASYAANLRDFDGNYLGSASGWKLIGNTDIQKDGDIEHILVNQALGRWATIGPAEDGLVYFGDHGWAGDTRVVGIYTDPLVQSGQVTQGGPFDSQRRFANDLTIGNIKGVLGGGDYDKDGFQEVYFSLSDGSAFLHAYMHADGNIRYANYQSQQQVIDFLTANGFSSSTWAGWFG